MISTSSRTFSTVGGLLSILAWSTTIGFARRVSETVGVFRGPAWVFLLAGVLGTAITLANKTRRTALFHLPSRYVAVCGALFVAYSVMLYVGVGSAATPAQSIGVGLLNYLWPTCIILFSIVLNRTRLKLVPMIAGVCAGSAGAWLAMLNGSFHLSEALSQPVFPYVCGIFAALLWGLYSNLTRRYAAESAGNAVSIFLLMTGGVFFLLANVIDHGPAIPTTTAVASIAYLAVVPSLIAYTLWDYAMRRGHLVLVASLAYATPILSTAFSALLLGVRLRGGFWLAAVLVMVGALLCRSGVEEVKRPA